MDEIEKSDSGDPIYRYSESESKKFEPAFGNGDSIDAISNHIEKCIGPIESVFHEIVSDQVYSDIVDDIWKYYQQDIVDKYLNNFTTMKN